MRKGRGGGGGELIGVVTFFQIFAKNYRLKVYPRRGWDSNPRVQSTLD